MSWPLPAKALNEFANSVDELHVVEEASTYLSDAVKATGVILDSFQMPLPADGEIHPQISFVRLGESSRSIAITKTISLIVHLHCALDVLIA